MVKDIFKNYNAFYNMVLGATLLSNAQTVELETDAKKIINFIGNAYNFSDNFIDYCTSVILNQLSALGRMSDRQAVYSSRSFNDNYTDEDILFDIKGDVLAVIQNIGTREEYCTNESWFDYSHYKTYQADIRYTKIATASSSGDLITTRQVGIMRALGIGCDVDFDFSIMRLTQCVLWGDIPSIHYLAYVYKLSGDDKKSAMFCEVAELANKYLLAGYTVLPEKIKQNYSEEARINYVYISSITQDIVRAHCKDKIDFSFIEAITSDTLDYYERMDYINNYLKQEWKNVTNSSEKPTKKVGFN